MVSSNRPYLVRAIYDWLVDNGLTPHLLVKAEGKGVIVPRQYVEQGQIVLNIGPTAVRDLIIGNDMISFNARFGGTPMDVQIPPANVLGIYARENGQGMLFPEEDAAAKDAESPDDPNPPSPRTRPALKVIK